MSCTAEKKSDPLDTMVSVPMRILVYTLCGVVFLFTTLFGAGKFFAHRYETVPRAMEPSDPETFFLETQLGRVHALDQGHGSTLLLLHGTGRSIADWQEGLVERLSRNHRVVAFDYFGHGLSDRHHGLAHGSALWARQGIAVLDSLSIERATVIGHSVGGVVAALLAADAPDRVDRAVFIGHGIAMDPMQIVPFIPGLGEFAMGRTAIFSTVFSKSHRRRLEAAYRIRGTRAALLVYIRRQYTVDGFRLLFRTYEDIEIPVLQIHGTNDESISIEAGRRITPRLRDSRFVAVEGASHDVHIDAPDRLVTEIESFLGEAGDP